MNQETKVVNFYKEPFDVYIGRAGKGQSGLYGNPFALKDGSREDAIDKFREYFYHRISVDAEYHKAVLQLRGKILGCPGGCKPNLACHGDIYAEYLNNLEDIG